MPRAIPSTRRVGGRLVRRIGRGARLRDGAARAGSDTGGSLRIPAAFAGIVGFRPSSGLVPSESARFGWSNLSTDGPMARNVDDLALMLSVLASDDGRDPLAYTLPGEAVRGGPSASSRCGRPISARSGSPRPRISASRRRSGTCGACSPAGSRRSAPLFRSCEEATPDCRDADDTFAVLRAALFLGRHGETVRTRPHLIGPNVRANVEEGLGYDLGDAVRAATNQTRLYRAFAAFFTRYDVLVSPAITLSPRPWSELYPAEIDGAPTRSYFHWLALAYAVTLAGHPALSLPLGRDEAGMPFGLQIVGPRGGDALVLGSRRRSRRPARPIPISPARAGPRGAEEQQGR